MFASSLSWRAFSRRCSSPARCSSSLRCSDALTERVPTSTGRPCACTAFTRSRIASHFSGWLGRMCSPRSWRATGRLVGIFTTARPYVLPQFAGNLARGSGHSGQPEVALEEALIGHARDRGLLARQRHAFLRLDHLVQTLLPRSIGKDPAGVLVDDLDLILPLVVRCDEILLVAMEHVQRRERLASRVPRADACRLNAGGSSCAQSPSVLLARLRRAGRCVPSSSMAKCSVGRSRAAVCKRGLVHLALRRLVRPAGDDERRARLVDQHAVGLVDDGEEQPAQHELPRPALRRPRAFRSTARMRVDCRPSAMRSRR